ncbi:MAG TPA: DUF342 domain-containing protein [Clostridiaceae bacterium]|nr:DUF342 domain-containing protein [Clostridiaceae bacterium]
MLGQNNNNDSDNRTNAKSSRNFSITLSNNKLYAYITLPKNEDAALPTYEDINSALKKSGIIYGIDHDRIRQLIADPVFGQPICIASGTPPVNGDDGKIKLLFDTSNQYKPTITEDGKVDFHELNIIESVRKGQQLCVVIPPTKGVMGKSVTGEEIPAREGKFPRLPKGKNVEASEDNLSLVASIDGHVRYVDNKISVFPYYEVSGDIDNSTGNISFIGDVVVKGNVLSGFTIEAGGTVEVWGVVEGAYIKAGEDIILRHGMRGMGKGVLRSGRDIVAKYIENSTIEAKNDIKSDFIMHSNVKCGNKLILTGRKGLLVGGVCCVAKEVYAKTIGSQMAALTEIEVGINPEVRKRIREIKEKIPVYEENMMKSEQVINILSRFEALGTLPDEKKEMLSKCRYTKSYFSNLLQELKQELQCLEAQIQGKNMGKVHCSSRVYYGVKIIIGSSSMTIKENIDHCTIYLDGADIKIGPYLG